jgi:hypothetical protein
MLDNIFVSTCGEAEETMAYQNSGYGPQEDGTSHRTDYFSYQNSAGPQPTAQGSEEMMIPLNSVLSN